MPLTQVSSRLIEDTLRYVLGASGTNHYTFTGKGLTGAVNDPSLTLSRGHTYVFENRNSSGSHPFYIKTSIANGGTNDAYNTGVTNNGGAGGTEIVFTVPHDAPDLLYYQCSSHSSMAGEFKIAGSVADGSITTAKLADDAVTASKIFNGAVTNTKLGTNAVTEAKIDNGAISTAKIAADAVTGAKIADDAVDSEHYTDGSIDAAHIATDAITSAKILYENVTAEKLASNSVTTAKIADLAVTNGKLADQAVSLDKLPHGTSSNDGKFLRANNGADPTFETVSTDLNGLTDVTISTTYPLKTSNPPSGVGHVWINKSTGDVYVLTDATSNENQWRNVGDRSGGVNEKTPIQAHDNTWFYARFDDSASVSGNNIVNLAAGSSALNVTIPKDTGSRTASSGSTTMQFSSETQAVRHNFTNADPLSPSTHGLTCGALFKKSSASGGNGVIYYGDTGTDNHFFWRTDFSNNNTIYVGEDTNTSDIWTEAITGVNDNEWIFAVISVDTNGTLRASRDGGNFSVVRSSGTAPTPTDAHFGIQGDMYNDNAANHEFAAFFFYKGIMTDAQVLSEYNYLKTIWSIT